jgi:hypothetical protein
MVADKHYVRHLNVTIGQKNRIPDQIWTIESEFLNLDLYPGDDSED